MGLINKNYCAGCDCPATLCIKCGRERDLSWKRAAIYAWAHSLEEEIKVWVHSFI